MLFELGHVGDLDGAMPVGIRLDDTGNFDSGSDHRSYVAVVARDLLA